MNPPVVVFDGAEDYHALINDPALYLDETCILAMRYAGPLGWPGSAEVVNMQPPDRPINAGVESLPCIGDGRQSGTSDSPSILHVSPEAALGGGLALLRDGDRLMVDLDQGRCDVALSKEELAERMAEAGTKIVTPNTLWDKLFMEDTTQLSNGMVLRGTPEMRNTSARLPKHNH